MSWAIAQALNKWNVYYGCFIYFGCIPNNVFAKRLCILFQLITLQTLLNISCGNDQHLFGAKPSRKPLDILEQILESNEQANKHWFTKQVLVRCQAIFLYMRHSASMI